jgi:hypothetical protein
LKAARKNVTTGVCTRLLLQSPGRWYRCGIDWRKNATESPVVVSLLVGS